MFGKGSEDLSIISRDMAEGEEGGILHGPRQRKGFLSWFQIGEFEFGRIDPRDGSKGIGIERDRSEVTGSKLSSKSGLPDGGILQF